MNFQEVIETNYLLHILMLKIKSSKITCLEKAQARYTYHESR